VGIIYTTITIRDEKTGSMLEEFGIPVFDDGPFYISHLSYKGDKKTMWTMKEFLKLKEIKDVDIRILKKVQSEVRGLIMLGEI